MKAVLRRIRIAPKKANLVAGMVRGKKVQEALNLLRFMPKKAAKILYKVIHSAAANARHNYKQSIKDLYISRLLVTKGTTLKRSLPVSRGRTHPILKHTSHITVEVAALDDTLSAPKTKKKDSAKAVTEKTEASEKAAAPKKSKTTRASSDKKSKKTSA